MRSTMRSSMRSRFGNFLLLSFVLLSSAKEPQSCSAPPQYPNTRLTQKTSSRNKFRHEEKVYFRCAPDFSPYRGIPVVQCVDGLWTKLTLKCEKNSCGNAGDLPNGQFHYDGNSYIGEKVHAECNEGFTLKGPSFMICKKSGWSGEFPTCEEGVQTCSSPAVVNAVSSSGASVHHVGDAVNFTCSRGFQLDGAQRIICSPDGRWQPQPPECLPIPVTAELPEEKAGGCSQPLADRNTNAVLDDSFILRKSFFSGDKVYYVCNVGYAAAGGSRSRKCIDGKWSPLRLRCERKLCGPAGEIINGQFEYTGVQFGDTATAVCDQGHKLVGQARRVCMSSGWDGRIPVCQAVVCEEPPAVEDADMIGLREPPYIYRSAIIFKCRSGVLAGPAEIWCTEDGVWSDPPPTCKVTTCPPPDVPHAFWSFAHKKVHQPGDVIQIKCNHGLMMSGPNTLTCSNDGRWLPSLPECTRKLTTCPPPQVPYAQWTSALKKAHQPGDVIQIRCNGAFMSGPNTLTCGNDGRWLPSLPECTRRSSYTYKRG